MQLKILQKELQKLKEKHLASEKNLFKYLQKIDGFTYHLKEKAFQFFSTSKSKQFPITRSTVPVFHSDKLLALLHFNGFNKDHQTLVVKLLLQKFLEGFFWESSSTRFELDQLTALFLLLLEKFSPDIYQTAFTFGLTLFDFEKNEIFFYGLQQNELLIISPNGQSVPLAGKVIEVESELKNFINAIKTKIDVNQWIVWYYDDSKPVGTEKIRNVIADALEKCNSDLQQFVLLLDQQIQPTDQDVCFSVLRIR